MSRNAPTYDGERIEEAIANIISRLREKRGGQPVLFMRERLFKVIIAEIPFAQEPLCLIIKGEPVPVCIDESIYEHKEETEGVTVWEGDICVRFFDLEESK